MAARRRRGAAAATQQLRTPSPAHRFCAEVNPAHINPSIRKEEPKVADSVVLDKPKARAGGGGGAVEGRWMCARAVCRPRRSSAARPTLDRLPPNHTSPPTQPTPTHRQVVYCRCWRSAKFPLCDGAHVKHNEATGDNVGPLIVSKQ